MTEREKPGSGVRGFFTVRGTSSFFNSLRKRGIVFNRYKDELIIEFGRIEYHASGGFTLTFQDGKSIAITEEMIYQILDKNGEVVWENPDFEEYLDEGSLNIRIPGLGKIG